MHRETPVIYFLSLFSLVYEQAGAAGLAAIINSRPFDLPIWLPEILDLAAPLVDYPHPISKIVIKGKHHIHYALNPYHFSKSELKLFINHHTSPLRILAAFDSFWTSHRSTWSSTSNMFDVQQLERLTVVFERIRCNVLCA
jgi:hypothetical protein